MKQIYFILFCLTINSLSGQSIYQKLQNHQSAYPVEKIYISHNQAHYAAGDTLYGKIFLVNGRSHQYFEGTPIVYVDWIAEDGAFLENYIVKIKDGTANLTIPIQREYGEGRFFLRAYTQYQKNFEAAYIFQKEIKIIGEEPLNIVNNKIKKTDFSLQFYPEGGRLVAGLASTIAFKAQNSKGESIEVAGKITNKKGEILSPLKTLNEGIGILNLSPKWGEKYKAEIEWNGQIQSFELPSMLKEGFCLNINNRKAESMNLQLASNTKSGLYGCTLIGHIRGQIFLNQTFKARNEQKLIIDKTTIPSGVLHFTLFDNKNRPICERLVFNNNPKEKVKIKIEMDKTDFGLKELVKGKIHATIDEKLMGGELSISVYNKALFPKATSGINIKNYLLLQSDLKGKINQINQYFEAEDAKSRTLLDYVMLTHGWRRFNWQDVLAEKPMPIIYPTEESMSFAGKVMKDNNQNNPIKADVFLNILDGKHFASVNLTTTEDGLFHFKGFDLPDSTEILIQGNIHNAKKKGKLRKGEAKRTGNKHIKFELLNLHELAFDKNISLKNRPYHKTAQRDFAKSIQEIRKVDTIYHPEWSINLDAVTVKAQRLADKEKRKLATKQLFKKRGLFYSDASQKVYMEDLTAGGAQYINIYDLIRDRIGGAQIRTVLPGTGGKRVILRAESSLSNPTYAIFEVDGVIVSYVTAESIVPSDVVMIDVKKGLSATSIYGEAGKGGVITIITKSPIDKSRNIKTPGILSIQHPGYHKARTFYIPDYSDESIDKNKPDYRTTLYWNADATLNSKTATPFSFYTGDKLSEFLIYIEGITKDGLPFVGAKEITVGRNAN